jgi:hypothetical protein
MLPCIFSEKYEKFGKQFLVQNIFYVFFGFFSQKLGFRIFQFFQRKYIETYNYLYLLDSEKSKAYHGLSWERILDKKNFGQKKSKNDQF